MQDWRGARFGQSETHESSEFESNLVRGIRNRPHPSRRTQVAVFTRAETRNVRVASPEYAGSLAGVVKNALDWMVGSGELYRKPVALISAGISSGIHTRNALVQTLTWQGAHVVASLGIGSPRTKSGAHGAITAPQTITDLRAVAHLMVQAVANDPHVRMELVRSVMTDAGVDPEHIAPPE